MSRTPPALDAHGYHITLLEALRQLGGISEAAGWATASMARACQETGKPVCNLTLADLQHARASTDTTTEHTS